ncbi:MAG: glycosyltransferase [Planctomycetota bacterium]|nr:glycosyltransferase [Planctomycetota bacterium]
MAVLIPCRNEAGAVGQVIDDFRRELPQAEIHVFDNCSDDGTAEVARLHGAVVHREPRKGKGFVVSRMFEMIRADYYVMVDGDGTYPAERVRDLLDPVVRGEADMVVGARLAQPAPRAFPPLHTLGNRLIRWTINRIFRTALTDVLSGYRAFNDRVVWQVPVISEGFEIESELTINLLYYRLKILEVAVPYRERMPGTQSKLRTFRDGFRVIWKILSLFRSCKPLTFFGGLGLVLLALGLGAGTLPLYEYVTIRYVYRVPMAVLAASLVILAMGSAGLGILLHAINIRLMELHSVMTRPRQ